MFFIGRTAANFLYKAVFFPAILTGISTAFPGWIQFSSWVPVAALSGLFLVVGLAADETILPLFGNVKATAQGFLFMFAMIWLAPLVFPGVYVHFAGALLSAGVLSMAELLMHRWLLRQIRRERTAS